MRALKMKRRSLFCLVFCCGARDLFDEFAGVLDVVYVGTIFCTRVLLLTERGDARKLVNICGKVV